MMQKKLVAPDGGWGWAVMFAYALYNLIFIPIMQNFGLIFKDTFAMMGLSATDGTIIITTNAAMSMLTGIVNGPLLRRFSYRKVSVAGAVLITLGLILTSFATKFYHFLLTYGLIASLGVGFGMSSYSLALNSYFVKRRSKATGFAFTITGLGPILMPQLISLLLSVYSVQGTVLIVAAISAHTFIAAALLQPVRWHMKVEMEEVEAEKKDNEENEKKTKEETHVLLENGHARENPRRRASVMDSNLSLDHDAETQSIYGYDATSIRKDCFNGVGRARSVSTCGTPPVSQKTWFSTHSVNSVHLGSSLKIFDEKDKDRAILTISEGDEQSCTQKPLVAPVYNPDLSVKKASGCCKGLVNFFDLSLFKDPIYVNIMVGVSLAIFAELNFSLLTPFILADIGLTTQGIATFLSVLSIADLIFRFISPFIGDYFKMTARVMYMISLGMLIVTRFTLLLFSDYWSLMGVAVGLGVAKGVRTVYMTLVIPNYVPIERLAAASGLQMVVNGLLILIGGPLLGVIRDITGSYSKCIYAMNFMTLSCLIIWTTELVYLRVKAKKKAVTEKG